MIAMWNDFASLYINHYSFTCTCRRFFVFLWCKNCLFDKRQMI